MDRTTTHSDKGAILAIAGLGLVLLLVAMDQTIVGTALPRIVADLHGFSLYSWVTTAYLLTETAVIPIASKLGDMYGRKWITIAGVALFIGCSALCGLAPNMLWLVICRGLQGLGGGTIFSTVFTLIADIFPDPIRRARYQGLFGGVFAFASVVAPFVGGILTDALSWHWIFYVNLPLGLFALAVLPRVLPLNDLVKNARIDFLGAISMTIGVVLLLLALTAVGDGASWTAPSVLIGLVLALVCAGLFLLIEQRAAEPIVPLRLFRNRTLSVITVVLFLFGIAMFGVVVYTPLFVQGVLGQTATGSGTILLPLVLTMSVVSILIGQMIGRLGSLRIFLMVGMGLLSLGAFLLSTMGSGTSSLQIGVYLFIIGVGLGLAMPLTTLAVQTVSSQSDLGAATSMTQFIRSIGSTVGTAVVAWLVTRGYTDHLDAASPTGTPSSLLSSLASPNVLISSAARNGLDAVAGATGTKSLIESLLAVARDALSLGIHDGMLFVAGCGMLAVCVVAVLPRINIKLTLESENRSEESALSNNRKEEILR